MRSLVRHGLILSSCLVATVLGVGCEGKQQTEYITGVSTQMSVPKDLKAIRIEISIDGQQIFCQGYRAYQGKVLLPRSLGNFIQTVNDHNLARPVRYSILGVAQDLDESTLFAVCDNTKLDGKTARILRRSTQPYVKDEILLLPMPLKFSCLDKNCPDDKTCKGGQCVTDVLTDAEVKALPKYAPELVDGTGATCFSTTLCLAFGVPALPVNTDDCTIALAESKDAPPPPDPLLNPFRPKCASINDCNAGQSEENGRQCTNGQCDFLPAKAPPWTGLNVEIAYDGGHTTEVLDLDPVEGFSIPDPSKPQQFRLAPGLCNLLKGTEEVTDDKGNKAVQPTAHRITSIRASGTCSPKAMAQPICYEDQLKAMGADASGNVASVEGTCQTIELKPPKAALMVVVDSTQEHAAFFDAKQIALFDAPLRDPAFQKTDIGLMFAPGKPGTNGCDQNALAPAFPFPTPAAQGVKTFKDQLLNFGPHAAAPTPQFEGALRKSYGLLSALDDNYLGRAVLVIGNRGFNADDCTGDGGKKPADLAFDARTKPVGGHPISTYAMKILQAGDGVGLGEVYVAGLQTPAYTADASNNKIDAKRTFQQIINELATCVFDVPKDQAPDPKAKISYSDPLVGRAVEIVGNAACNKADFTPGTNGWGLEPGDFGTQKNLKRIHICGDDCAAYRKTLSDASDFAALYQQPPVAMPVFARTAACGELPLKK